MYSFAQRSDCKVHDEPLYPYWLNNNPNIYRPYRDKLISEAETLDPIAILSNIASQKDKKVIFLKHIVRQAVGFNRSIFVGENVKHVFLIRDPIDMVHSWNKVLDVHQEECSINSLCFPQMLELFSELRQLTGVTPLVVDSNNLKADPHATLNLLCQKLNIPFFEEQLSWLAGPKPLIDGY
jgi:hypothetical protein